MIKSYILLRSFAVFLLSIILTVSNSQAVYYPDSNWQIRKPSELKIDAAALDSAVSFAIKNETKTEVDLRIANLKAYVNEPGYKIT